MVDDIDGFGRGVPSKGRFGIANAFQAEGATLRGWLNQRASLRTARSKVPGETWERLSLRPTPSDGDSGLDAEEIWGDLSGSVRKFNLIRAWAVLSQQDTGKNVPFDDDDLLPGLFGLLPPEAQRVVEYLGVHGRGLAWEALTEVCDDPVDETISLLREHQIVHEWCSSYEVDGAWARWCQTNVDHVRKRVLHKDLARIHADRVPASDRDDLRRSLDVLEAHRHFIACGDLDRAYTFALFGSAYLLDAARRLSCAGKRQRSAAIYQTVLDLDMSMRQARPASSGIGCRPRAYATHYLHYNRAKAGLESLTETEQGYERSLHLWSENALFRSRHVLCAFYRNDWAGALSRLEEAKTEVPRHPDKELTLVARTADKLITHTMIGEALLCWGQRAFEGDRRLKPSWEKLIRALERGWRTSWLGTTRDNTVHLSRDVEVRVRAAGRGWVCVLDDLDVTHRGPLPLSAYEGAITALREEVGQVLGQLTHTLEPAILDVGQGDCTFIVPPEFGPAILFDCRDAYVAERFVKDHHISALDAVVASHLDIDHIRGMLPFLKGFFEAGGSVERFFIAHDRSVPKTAGADLLSAVLSWEKEGRLTIERPERGLQPAVVSAGDGWRVELVLPRTGQVVGMRLGGGEQPNPCSAVLRVQRSGTAILVGGDAPLSSWNSLELSLLPAAALRVSHHGGNICEDGEPWSAAEALYGKVGVKLAVISVAGSIAVWIHKGGVWDVEPAAEGWHRSFVMGMDNPLCLFGEAEGSPLT